jgi:hypothetical protein
MSRFDTPETRMPSHRRPGVRRGTSRRGCHVGSPYERPRLRLVSTRRRAPTLPFGIHPALPSTLAFAALSVTALAVAAVVDVANAVARTALVVGTQVRAAAAGTSAIWIGQRDRVLSTRADGASAP